MLPVSCRKDHSARIGAGINSTINEDQTDVALEGDRHFSRQETVDRAADHLRPPSGPQAGIKIGRAHV